MSEYSIGLNNEKLELIGEKISLIDAGINYNTIFNLGDPPCARLYTFNSQQILNLSFSDLDKASPTWSGYIDYVSDAAFVSKGQVYKLSVTVKSTQLGCAGDCQARLKVLFEWENALYYQYIIADWNDATGIEYTFEKYIRVPSNIINPGSRIRAIVGKYSASTYPLWPNPCFSYDVTELAGQCIDYGLNIT